MGYVLADLGRALLNQAYSTLSEYRAQLLDADASPEVFADRGGTQEIWTDLGDWLGLAARLGAEKVLFVRGEPVIVFSDLGATPDAAALGDLYRRAWCMSQPRYLFVAMPGEVRVYALDRPPGRDAPPGEPWRVLATVADVLGFADAVDRFGPDLTDGPRASADRRLIDDLRHVRSHLEGAGLTMAQAHALIGRSILIRYLEDRGVLNREYFERVAADNRAWKCVLDDEGPTPIFGTTRKDRFYDRVLCDPGFTHALFATLASHFNGDLFALGDAWEERFSENALKLLRNFLLGEAQTNEPPLFFWAYDFEVVPLSLISSIYEQFYHDSERSKAVAPKSADAEEDRGAEADDDDGGGTDNAVAYVPQANSGAGTHYTPATLVHDALRRTLSAQVLGLRPKVLDLACGSGIFLVEAFRRVVRFEAHERRGKLPASELRAILQHRIAGVEKNAEAARVAAFSLYLALLDQQEPPDILAAGSLPHLLHSGVRDDRHYGTVVIEDAFALTPEERQIIEDRIGARKVYDGRATDKRLLAAARNLELPSGGFDVVVGNPPWQEAPSEKSVPRLWAASFRLPAGEGSFSQLFIHRALALLRQGGILGLLVNIKVFWNDRDTSRAFRAHILERATLKQLVNMTHVRRVFFAKAVAPFAFILAENKPPDPDARFVIWNARRTRAVNRVRSMAAVSLDRRIVAQRDVADADHLWKAYWWGSHRDAALASRLCLERTLDDAVEKKIPAPGYGWQRGDKQPTGLVATLPELDNKAVQPFGPLRKGWFLPPPTGVGRNPDQRIYEGRRLVITHGVREPIGPVARLETEAFTFRHSFYSVPLPDVDEDQAKVILGVLWSSLGRYKLFMTSGSWGGWHDKVTARDLLGIPLRLSPSWGMPRAEHNAAVTRIVEAVDHLRSKGLATVKALLQPATPEIYESDAPEYEPLLALDEAVFDLFEISPAERDLVADFWAESHDLYWKGAASAALKPVTLPKSLRGRRSDIPENPSRGDLQRYLAAFLDAWDPHQEEGRELAWEVLESPDRNAIAVAFVPVARGAALPEPADDEWKSAMARCSATLVKPAASTLPAERVVRAVAGDSFVVLKENTRRRWTASAALEDAEAWLVQLAPAPRS